MWAAARRVTAVFGRRSVVRALVVHCLDMHTHLYIVRERLSGDAGLDVRFSPGVLVGHEHESLILAQNERWRHA